MNFLKEALSRLPGSATTQTLLFGALVGFVFYFLTRKRYRLPPGPFALPLVGNFSFMRDKKESLYVKLGRLAREKYGPVITVYLGPVPCVTLNSLDVIKEALIKKGADFAGRPYVYSLDIVSGGGQNVAFADYSPGWHLRRKIQLRAVKHYMRGSHMEKTIHKVVQLTAEKMLAESGSPQSPKPLDPHPHITLLMYHIMDNIIFGDTKHERSPSPEGIMAIFDAFLSEVKDGLLEDVFPLFRLCPTPRFRRAMKHDGEIVDYIRMNFDEHQRTFSPGNIRDLADSLLLAQNEAEMEENTESLALLSQSALIHSITDIFFASIDTSRTTLEWSLLLLAGHPKIQTRMQAEIDAATGPRLPGIEDRDKLHYCEATLYEVMRLSTAAPTAVPHKTTCDTSVGGYEIPKDTMVFVNLWAVMHDPDLWEESDEFRPERFLDNSGTVTTRAEGFVPFSIGRRSCVGETVVKLELLLILTCLLKRFTVSLPPGQKCQVTYGHRVNFLNPPERFQILVSPR